MSDIGLQIERASEAMRHAVDVRYMPYVRTYEHTSFSLPSIAQNFHFVQLGVLNCALRLNCRFKLWSCRCHLHSVWRFPALLVSSP